MPARNTSYTAAGQALLDKRKMPEEEISDKETLHIAREAAQKSGGFLQHLGWSRNTLSPFILSPYNDYTDWVALVESMCPKDEISETALQKNQKKATSREEVTDEDTASVFKAFGDEAIEPFD